MITITLADNQARELLTLLLNQRKWLEWKLEKEKDEMKKQLYANSMRIIDPLIKELERKTPKTSADRHIREGEKTRWLKVRCMKCGYEANVLVGELKLHEAILEHWTCPNNCGVQYYRVVNY